jgi:hypothetical protein
MTTNRRGAAAFCATTALLGLALAGCAMSPSTSSSASPSGVRVEATTSADDLRELGNLAACYTEGIDALGVANVEAGTAIWRRCFSEDVAFTLSFGPSYSVTCPGEKCPLPPTMNGLARRVAMARGTYERAGYVATSHHITTLGIERPQGDVARVKGHLQAWHVRKDGATVLGLGTWEVEARRTPAGWRIVDEKLASPLRVVMPKAE